MRLLLRNIIAVIMLVSAGPLLATDGKDIVRFSTNVFIAEGTAVQSAVAVGGDVTVNGTVGKDAVAVGGSVILGPRAVIGNNAVSVGGTIQKDAGAVINGDVVEVTVPGVAGMRHMPGRAFREFFLGFRILAFIGFLALALITAAVFPRPVTSVSYAVEKQPGKTALWGIIGALLFVPVMVLLAISIIGIILIPVEIVAVIVAAFVGYVALAQLVGKKIIIALGKHDQPLLWETFWGLLLIGIAGMIPVLGWLVRSLVFFMGFGGVIVALLNLRKVSPHN